MSKITFRADDELIDKLEGFDQSKSEVMRNALREYLEAHPEAVVTAADSTGEDRETVARREDSLEEVLAERLDRLIERRLDDHLARSRHASPQDVNVNISLDGPSDVSVDESDDPGTTDAGEDTEDDPDRITCAQCGEAVGQGHVYCPNCGEKVSRLSFCECGDEIRSDWAFCPACGRRTPAADVLDST